MSNKNCRRALFRLHAVIGRLVVYCEQHKKSISELSLDELKDFSPIFEDDVYDAISLESCVGGRKVPGGPAPECVTAHIARLEEFLKK